METAPTPPAPHDPAETAAPPVVAVVVTCDPGWWLEECLASLVAQDYPALSVLVVDADSEEDPTLRVASVMPGAFVRHVKRRRGFGLAGNEVLGVVEGASHYLFCHDDVALAPGAVRQLVEEAFRANAGIVAPKLVAWWEPDRMLSVGMGVGGFGAPVGVVDRGELDQEQHDFGRDVFFAPAPCALVRADLFQTVGGFDGTLGVAGEDLDLGWRAHLAGARVVSAPAAVVRHLGATETGHRALDGHLGNAGSATEHPMLARRHREAEVEPIAFDDEEGPAQEGPTGRHATRRARRAAEREAPTTGWLGDAQNWEDEAWVPRRRTWRAAPVAPVRQHRVEVLEPGPEVEQLEDAWIAARLRTVASNYSVARLVTHLVPLLVLSLGKAAVELVIHGRESAGRVLRPWGVLLASSGAIRARRKSVRKIRRISDNALIDLQAHGVRQLRVAVPGAPAQVDDEPRSHLLGLTWIAAFAVIVAGTRDLLAGHLPLVGELAPFPHLATVATDALSGWRITGLGVAAPAPTVFGLLTIGGVILLGHMIVLQHVLVLGMIPLGAAGMSRLARPLESRRAQAVALVAYLAVPLPYNALATGSWSGLAAYAATPWVIALLLRAGGEAPFASTAGRPPLLARRRLVLIALVSALGAVVQPGFLVVVVLVGVGVAVGFVVTGRRDAAVRAVGTAVLGAAGGLILLFPWALEWLPPNGEWATFTHAATGGRVMHLATLLRFQTGSIGAGPIGYALLVAAALPLLIGHEWRGDWAARMWSLALVSFLAAWAGQHGVFGIVWPNAGLLLAPAAVALALSIALGVASFDTDLADFTFGWRQVVAGVAAAAALLACTPVAARAFDGRWDQQHSGYDALLSWMPAQRAAGDFRVLWLGSPAALPISGWRISDGLAYATSRNGVPDLTEDFPATSHGTTRLLGQAVQLVERNDIAQLGHLLAPMGVRYIVVVNASAPLDTTAADQHRVPGNLTAGLESQLDLSLVDESSSEDVFENAAWAPMRIRLPDAAVGAAQLNDPRAARVASLAQPPPVLVHQSGPTTFSGTVPQGPIEVAEAPSSHWHLSVAGHDAPRQPAFASANLFTVVTSGKATLGYSTPFPWRLAYLLGAILWIAALWTVLTGRRRVV